MTQPVLIGAELEHSAIEEFVSDFRDHHSQVEHLFLKLEDSPDDEHLVNELFRQVHSVKGNAQIVGLDIIADFVHVLEHILDRVRKKELTFSKRLADVVLPSLDIVADMCEQSRLRQPMDMEHIRLVQSQLREITQTTDENSSLTMQAATKLLKNYQPTKQPGFHPHLASVCDDKNEDLRFFESIALNAEARSPLWKNRTVRILHFATAMNREARNKVNQHQLDAAVYLHDFGMAFLPLNILHKVNSLTKAEINKIKLHPHLGASFIADNNNWKEAAEIILQHHEREDGQGYPNELNGKQICDGAKILAIADTYESITNLRAHRTKKMSLTQAITEINNCAGTQFSKYWVSVFNDVIRKIKVKKS